MYWKLIQKCIDTFVHEEASFNLDLYADCALIFNDTSRGAVDKLLCIVLFGNSSTASWSCDWWGRQNRTVVRPTASWSYDWWGWQNRTVVWPTASWNCDWWGRQNRGRIIEIIYNLVSHCLYPEWPHRQGGCLACWRLQRCTFDPGRGWAAPIYTMHEALRGYCPCGWGVRPVNWIYRLWRHCP